MSCINVSHPQFKVLLEETGLHPDVLKAMVSIWIDENNSDSFPTTEQLQLGTVTASEKMKDPLTDWLAEFDQTDLEAETESQLGNGIALITDFYNSEANWDHETDQDQVTEINNSLLFSLMNSPTLSITPENKKKLQLLAKAVSKTEAYRDYFEQNGVVRPSDVVMDKLEQRHSTPATSVFDEAFEVDDVSDLDFINEFEQVIQVENSKKAIDKIQQLSAQLGIEAEIVSPQVLESDFGITKPGVKGFYKNGKVYLVEGRFDQNTVFHEFCHPIIKSIAKENPELFLQLYQQVLNTPEGAEIFKGLTGVSKDYEVNSPEFMEEVIVQALDAKNKVPRTVLQNIMFHIKQWFRKKFGKKINISKLDVDTSLNDMLNMINEGGEFILDKDFLDKDDAIMFSREYQDAVDELTKSSAEATQLIVNDFYEMISVQLGNLLKSESAFKTLKDELTTEEFDGELQKLRKILDALTTSDRTKMANLPLSTIEKNDIELFQDKLNAFVNSLVQADKVLDKFAKKLQDLEQNKVTTNDDFDALFALETFVDDWKSFVNTLMNRSTILQFETTTTQKVEIPISYTDQNNPVGKLISDLSSKLNNISSRTNELKIESTIDMVYSSLVNAHTTIKQGFLDDMNALKKAGALSEYDKMHEEYYGLTLEELNELNFLKTQPKSKERDLRIDALTQKSFEGMEIKKEGIRAIFMNSFQDSTWLNGMFESYLQNQDKLVSGFANFVNDYLMEVNGNVNAIESDFLEGLKPLMKKAGFNNSFFGEAALGNAIQHTNISYEVDEFGNVNQFDEYAIISNFTGHEFELAKLKDAVVKAKEVWQNSNNDKHYALYMDAVFALEDFLNDYMTQENIPEYYEAEKLFRTPAGIEARKRKDELFAEMRLLRDNFSKDPTNHTISEAMKDLWFQYAQMQSKYDLTGNLKKGIDLEIAIVFQEYNEDTQDFHVYNEVPGLFEQELERFEEYLINRKKFTKGSEAYDQAVNDWIKYNTTVELTDDFYDKRKQLTERRQQLLKPLIRANAGIADVTPMYEQIYEMLKKTKSETGEYDGNKLTAAEQETIVKLHKEITEAEEELFTKSGLTKVELRHLNDLTDYYNYYNKFKTDNDKKIYNQYIDTMRRGLLAFGITPAAVDEINSIDKTLRSMVTSESTNVYLMQFRQLLELNEETKKMFYASVYQLSDEDDYATDLEDENDIFLHNHAAKILENMSFVDSLCNLNPEFKEWFERNHYTTLIPYRDENGVVDGEVEIYRKSAAWQYTRPLDKNSYKKKLMFSKSGSLIGFLEVDGVFRVPNMNFKVKEVKPEYRTEIVDRDYIDTSGNLVLANVDNRGRFLPRENAVDNKFVNANYRQMFETNRALFDLMLYVKNQYLDNQKGLDNSQKRYLTYPSIRKNRLENANFRGFGKRIIESLVSIFKSRVDDFEEGLSQGGENASGDKYNTLTRPITGNYNMDQKFVSVNIIKSMGLQLYSIESYKALRKINSFANLLKSSLEQFGVSAAAQRMKAKTKTLLRFTEKKDTARSNRLKQIDSIIDRHFKGKQIVGTNSKSIRFANILLKRSSGLTSFMSFALNLTASLTNFASGEIQILIKSVSDTKIFNLKDLTLATKPTHSLVRKLLTSSFSKAQKDVQVQLAYIMDAVPGLYERRVGDQGSRTVASSLGKGEFLFVDRKTLQDSTAIHSFYAILLHNKFNLNGRSTPLHKAVELVNGRLQTKPGVPKEFEISYDSNGKIILGSKIKEMMKLQQGTLIKVIGQANSISTPELFRHTLGKFAMYLMRFFPAMALDRYQFSSRHGVSRMAKDAVKLKFKKRSNLYTGRAEVGTLVGALEALKLMAQTRSYKVLPAASKIALLGTIAGVFAKILLDLFIRKGLAFNDDDDDPQIGFNYDPEDEHIYKKLRHSTGLPLNTPFVPIGLTPAGGTRYDSSDYWSLQVLRLSLRVQRELQTFDPGNAFTTSYALATLQSPLQEGGAGALLDLGRLTYSTIKGEPDQYDRAAGPLIWQQKGVNKAWNIFFKMLSITGKQVDPGYGIEMENKALEAKNKK